LKVAYVDPEVALMNALDAVVPKARILLYAWHINKNVLSKAEKELPTALEVKEFMDNGGKS
jgi:hypothetical protein